ncbi:MAG: flagellar hook assembly protein FlgD [Rhodobacteraceae bacterium]|nr:flagellar hook assembly protein FlgD [Paracoccaceae bacterium]
MVSVTPTTATATAATASASSGGGTAISSDFETFLKMLTVQMQNQDPMNPIESSDYAVQLATFSGVEQQVRTNDLLQALGDNLGAAGLAQYGGWVGMEARAAVPGMFDGTPITVLPNPATGADSAQLVVRATATGQEVQRLAIGTDGTPVSWAGIGADGTTLAPGSYSFSVESYTDGARIGESTAEVYAPITEVRSAASGITLVFEGGGEAAASVVSALRQAQG